MYLLFGTLRCMHNSSVLAGDVHIHFDFVTGRQECVEADDQLWMATKQG